MKLTPTDARALLQTLPDWRFDAARGGLIGARIHLPRLCPGLRLHEPDRPGGRAPQPPSRACGSTFTTAQVTLTTHDAGGLSMKDVELARTMDRVAAALAQ